jgi:hypothetical protein
MAITNWIWFGSPLEWASRLVEQPYAGFALRAALGMYVIWMARGFYADPLGYFRKWMPRLPELAWMRVVVRALAAFCVWGGCFIVASAIAAQILGLHGLDWAAGLVILAVVVAWLLLPKPVTPAADGEDPAGDERWRTR